MERSSPPASRVTFKGAGHVTLSDAVWLAEGAIKTGPMGPEKAVAGRARLHRSISRHKSGRQTGGSPANRTVLGISRCRSDDRETTAVSPAIGDPGPRSFDGVSRECWRQRVQWLSGPLHFCSRGQQEQTRPA